MSKVINFDAREFQPDKTCESNMFSKYFETDDSGRNILVYEIGDWQWNWTQICCEKKLEKNTDYIFRFVIVGGYCDTQDETSKFVVCPLPDGMDLDEAWANSYAYDLSHSTYKPVLSKKMKNGFLRLYEIPFNTFDCENFKFVFIAMHAVAKIYPPKDLSAYAGLEDQTYDEVFAERNANDDDFPFSSNNAVIDLTGAHISQKALITLIAQCGGNPVIDLTGAFIDYNGDEKEPLEEASTNAAEDTSNDSGFSLTNKAVYAENFLTSIGKLDDGSFIKMQNVEIIGSCEDEAYFSSSDGMNIELQNCIMQSSVFARFMMKIGDGCIVNLSNCMINDDGAELSFGSPCDGTVINLDNCAYPSGFDSLLAEKLHV